MNPLQALMDGMSAQWRKERSETQMTLGRLISMLEAMPPDAEVTGLEEPHSYRGYYSDLAFELSSTPMKAAELLAMCRGTLGQCLQGYKGGDFWMSGDTPLWVACYGCCGERIMELRDGQVITAPDAKAA